MNRDEARVLLTLRAAFEPNATVDEADLTAWSMVLDDIRVEDATKVLRDHYRESTFPVRPADIVERVKHLRAGRLRDWQTAGGSEPAPPVDPDDVTRSIAWTRAFRHAIGSGASTEQGDDYACQVVGVTRPPEVEAAPRPALTAALSGVTRRIPPRE